MKHGIKAKLSALIGFAALLTAVVFLGAQREDTKILELISQEYGPLIDFSIEQDAGIAMVSLSLAPDIPHEARIYYTLDGSVPDATDACYEEPLALPCEDVGEGVTIRAVISYGDQLSPTFTRTVLPLEHAGLPEDLVIVSISTDPANLYDYETGIMVEGTTYSPGSCLQISNSGGKIGSGMDMQSSMIAKGTYWEDEMWALALLAAPPRIMILNL